MDEAAWVRPAQDDSRPAEDAAPPPPSPSPAPAAGPPSPGARSRPGLAIPLLYTSIALAHVGGDERARVIGTLYALAALHHLFHGE